MTVSALYLFLRLTLFYVFAHICNEKHYWYSIGDIKSG